jgi:hypothetical protein
MYHDNVVYGDVLSVTLHSLVYVSEIELENSP